MEKAGRLTTERILQDAFVALIRKQCEKSDTYLHDSDLKDILHVYAECWAIANGYKQDKAEDMEENVEDVDDIYADFPKKKFDPRPYLRME